MCVEYHACSSFVQGKALRYPNEAVILELSKYCYIKPRARMRAYCLLNSHPIHHFLY